VPHLETYPHHHDPLDIVGLGEGRSPTAGIDVPGNSLDPMVTMVHIRGGRVTPPVKVVISVNPAVGTSTSVWAATVVGNTAAARALAQSAAGASAPVWAAAMVPLGCAATHCTAYSRTASLANLSSLSLSSSAKIELPVLLVRRASSSAAATRAASTAAAASTSALAAVSSAIASLATLTVVTAVSAAARSRSSVAATSASYRCCTLETTER
jgi:hypothetical protein